MKYTQPRFTLPASHNTSQQKWDAAFLSKEEFLAKHKMSSQFYDFLYLGAAATMITTEGKTVNFPKR